MSDHDPRKDPRPGDVLKRGNWEFHVSGRGKRGAVIYSTKIDGRWLNSTCRASIEDWMDETATAEVVARGKE